VAVIRNIRSLTLLTPRGRQGNNKSKFFTPNFYTPNFFTPNFFTPNFFTPTFFTPKNLFYAKKLILRQKTFVK